MTNTIKAFAIALSLAAGMGAIASQAVAGDLHEAVYPEIYKTK